MSRHLRSNSGVTNTSWSPGQAYVFAVVTLVIGFAAGYFVRGSAQTSSQSLNAPVSQVASSAAADGNVAPLLRQLEATPRDPALLAQIGNTYYDAKDYSKAIDYYKRALAIKPDTVEVRTDMATAIWYTGDADAALKEFDRSLQYQPNHGHTLFNIGIVKWQGKKDTRGAIATWNKLLALNPNYPDRQKVEQLIQQLQAGGA